ncbi:F-box protein At1g78280 [Impatiens glandulifera]|uniref:F-box protein At1g78280 n=1 Tax=Impatiens glandulifera TaxID=253017 RepID=UPI001FB0C23F|nr:F-box protein At1g78280 [Impatiens glandulifera]
MEVEGFQAQFLPTDRRFDALGDLRVLPDEILCAILTSLTPRDVARLSCVSSVMYILCNEEPLWMNLCLNNINGPLKYDLGWKNTTLKHLDLLKESHEPRQMVLRSDGFNSLFLLRRYYRCHTTLAGFSFDQGNVERKEDISLENFQDEFDGKKPVLLTGLAESWPARHMWTVDKLIKNYGDTTLRISQKSAKKISMKFKDYASYMNNQHDEDPLYIFDDKFGEVAPGLLEDYSVPHLFKEDYFDVLSLENRPAFRWLIIGPERSGASWHVDPALTSAWNTLLCGRKRWALYPPGRVPLGVTVHVNEEDGDVNIDTPPSLQWWLDFYPLLADEDKPIECTQLPGETIFVPSGWWHCILNLETTIAVTQNFVNSKNFEFACLDMAPGYQHKGVCRAGMLALEDGDDGMLMDSSDIAREGKRMRMCKTSEEKIHHDTSRTNGKYNSSRDNFAYDINFLEMFLDKNKNHYSSPWSSGNCFGPREMREWLYKLWVGKPGMRDLIWKGACIALSADRWHECLKTICPFHGLPVPTDDERFPIGMGSNPVYLIADNVVKLYVEGGFEACLYALGTELEFYSLLCKVKSPLVNHIPLVVGSGFIYMENESYKIVSWNGRGIPEMITNTVISEQSSEDEFPFGVWNRSKYLCREAGTSLYESSHDGEYPNIWPYIITKRCKGKIFADLRDTLSSKDTLNLASFLGEQLHNLHVLPCPSLHPSTLNHSSNDTFNIAPEWMLFIHTLDQRKTDVSTRLKKWGDPIPSFLIAKAEEYLPTDLTQLLNLSKDGKVSRPCSWIHSDIMDDNIHMEEEGSASSCPLNGNIDNNVEEQTSWRPSFILDFSDLSIGDPIFDIIPIYLDVFRGDPYLLKRLLDSYKLPLSISSSCDQSAKDKFGRLSYVAMCYCILHEDNILGAIFSMWKELREAKSWEEVEERVWGYLNEYKALNN